MLGEMLEWAVARRYINWNPARLAELPKDRSTTNPDAPAVYSKSRAKASFTGEQYAALIAVLTASGDHAFKMRTPSAYFVAMLSIGAARRGDDTAMLRGRTAGIVAKTGNRRDVEMTEAQAGAAQLEPVGPLWTADPRWADLVFTSELGTPIDPSHARRDFKKVCARAGVPSLSLYEIRHTVASLMVDADVPLREVADLLGHKDLEMVVKRYRHRRDGVVKSHVEVLGSLTAK